MSKYETDSPEANAMLALTVGDEEGARKSLSTMTNDELRGFRRTCDHLGWLADATINLRALHPERVP